MTLSEKVDPVNAINVLSNGCIEVREASVIVRDGQPDQHFPPRYRRYVLSPGDDLSGSHPRIAAIAAAIWPQSAQDASEPATAP